MLWTALLAGEGVSVLMSPAVQSVASVQQQQQQQPGRPTQQVQPVSSHFEEATGNYMVATTDGGKLILFSLGCIF